MFDLKTDNCFTPSARSNAWLDYGVLKALGKSGDLTRYVDLLSACTAESGLMHDTGREQSFIEDKSETPAPQFAIRAFKSALLGTPNIKQSLGASHDTHDVADTADADQHTTAKASRTLAIDLPLSPTKGILVTPGTGANKRKTVSFGSLAPEDKHCTINLVKDKNMASRAVLKDLQSSEVQADASPMKRETTLTKSLFEAQLGDSKRRIGMKSTGQMSENDTKTSLDHRECSGSNAQARPSPRIPDTTVDLDIPCSISGKHWKGEYEQYQRQSNRELKRIIQHGQTIKSYAQRKDSEATSLSEKLNDQIAKAAAMEVRVSELVTELANARVHGAIDQDDSAETISELAKQTALAIRYKQKADQYKVALDKRAQSKPSPEQVDDCVCASLEGGPPSKSDAQNRQMDLLSNDLERLRSAVQAAEEKSLKLQHENITLKQRMARVKDEMKSYETRRLAREERLKKRETKLIMGKESCEAKLASLLAAYDKLQRRHDKDKHVSGLDALPTLQSTAITATSKEKPRNAICAATSIELANKRGGRRTSQYAHESDTFPACPGREKGEIKVHRTSPLFHENTPDPALMLISRPDTKRSPCPNIPDARESSIGIWTQSIKGSLEDDNLAIAETLIDSGFSFFKREAQDVLQEIDQNAVAEQAVPEQGFLSLARMGDGSETPIHKSSSTSTPHRMPSRQSTIVSPRPSMLSFTPNPTKPCAQPGEPNSNNILGEKPFRIPSGGTRTLTMGSRTGHLPPDRVEAARKRLDARKGKKRPLLEGLRR